MLFEMADEWEMEFAEGAQNALELMQGAAPFDIVVSDMKMPGMDGGSFLHEVARRCPNAVRVVLSGYAENDLVLNTVGNVHQFLAKPIDGDMLIDVLRRALELRSLLEREGLTSVVSSLNSVPSLPAAYSELMEVLQSPGCSIQAIGEVISGDVGMSLKVMQLVNSAFFGLPTKVSDPAHAVSLLGVEVIKALVVSVHVFSRFEYSLSQHFSLEEFTHHSLGVGALAREIAAADGGEQAEVDDALIAGLFHDIGKLIIADNLPRFYDESYEYARDHSETYVHGEEAVHHATHAEIGAYLLGLWAFRDNIVEAVAYHHRPQDCVAQNARVLMAVYVADTLLNAPDCSIETVSSLIDMNYITSLGLGNQLGVWCNLCSKTKQNIVMRDVENTLR